MTTVTDNTELMAALAASTGGETILCDPGNYGDVTLSSKEYTSPVTVRSSDQGNMAVIESFDLTGVTNLHFAYIDFDRPDLDGSANTFDNSHYCQIRFCTFQGGNSAGGFPIGSAVEIDNGSSFIRVEGCDISNWHYFFFIPGGNNLAIVNNDMTGFSEDAVHMVESADVLFEGNLVQTAIDDGTGAHNDHFQMWQPATEVNRNVVIRGNIFLIGSGGGSQTIFSTGNMANVLIEHNVIFNAQNTSIRTSGEAIVRNNSVFLDLAYGVGGNEMVVSGGALAQIYDNSTVRFWNSPAANPNDIWINYENTESPTYVETMFVNAHLLTSDPTLADLMFKAEHAEQYRDYGADVSWTGKRHRWQPKMHPGLQLRAAS